MALPRNMPKKKKGGAPIAGAAADDDYDPDALLQVVAIALNSSFSIHFIRFTRLYCLSCCVLFLVDSLLAWAGSCGPHSRRGGS